MLLVFDWDGTLINSMDKIVSCMQLTIDELGFPDRSDQEIKSIIGLSLPVAAQVLFPDVTDQDVEALRLSYKKHFAVAEQTPCNLYEGVEEGLSVLREQGHQLAVATGKSRQGLDAVLKGLGWQDFFDATRCADEAKSKPDPLMLTQLQAEFSVSAADMMMVGDTDFDLKMADLAGVDKVAVTYGAHPVERLRRQRPDLLIDRFQQLLAWDRLR